MNLKNENNIGLRFISDEVDVNKMDRGKFNLIASGTGTGKSTFIMNDLLDKYPDVEAKDVIFVTSRSMIVEQQVRNDGVKKLYKNNMRLIDYWNGESDSESINQSDISIMTYDVFIDIIKENDFIDHDVLENVKIIIFDECHTIFSDDFIQDIEVLKVWTSFMIKKMNKIFLGLTATPYILHYAVENKTWGVEINQLNENILINYKTEHLICTTFDTIPYLITSNSLKGKTLVMCYTVEDCYKLKNQIPNSAVLVSKNNKRFNEDMEILRNYIVKNANLPKTYNETHIDENGNKVVDKKLLKVLITTSTLREGVNIEASSNVKNVVSCFTDELHIVQFAGRCRHNLENLVIADTYVRSDNRHQNKYLAMRRKQFRDFLYSNSSPTEWFDTIKHITDIPIFKIYKVRFSRNMIDFINYINNKWLVPVGTIKQDVKKYYIYKKEDKQEIIDIAKKYKIMKVQNEKFTFNRIVDFMKYSLGYKVDDGRDRVNNHQYRYKLVVDYDRGKGNFVYVDSHLDRGEDDEG